VKIYVTAVEALKKKQETQFTTKKLVENQVWVPVISFCKIFIPGYMFHGLLCRNWPFLPRNRLTLQITLTCDPKKTFLRFMLVTMDMELLTFLFNLFILGFGNLSMCVKSTLAKY
jgi:hypothetical protein